eukprot:CAMPEP_0119501196 /NCGR_PEP_ID=MMETSP1344-20130328/23109_1 /TAXON_ID=236787 /ORGANISM="Florenciella parvula, Strain CCMP2471" /LENGTH=85 /DNA_ID=CAMNT_0007537349 /DNA_START=105 /DNA_END=359 /DNA_ORIENTATION=-
MQPAADRTDAVALVRGRGEQDPTPSRMYGRGSLIEPRVESTRSHAAGGKLGAKLLQIRREMAGTYRILRPAPRPQCIRQPSAATS